MISLFCRISSLWLGSFAKETYNFKEPTSRSHPIGAIPRVKWRWLTIGCGNLIQMSLYSGSSDISRFEWESEYFGEMINFKTK